MAGSNGSTPIPADNDIQEAPRIIIDPSVSAPDGSFWIFNGTGYDKAVEPWAVVDHIHPVRGTIALGDVEAWTDYVRRFVPAEQVGRALLVWSERGRGRARTASSTRAWSCWQRTSSSPASARTTGRERGRRGSRRMTGTSRSERGEGVSMRVVYSVDFAFGRDLDHRPIHDERWWFIDAAAGERSWHPSECPHAREAGR